MSRIVESPASRDARLVLSGDPVAMAQSDRVGPALFARALNLMIPIEQSMDDPDPVVAAAAALSAELTGERDAAVVAYRRLARRRDPYVALLGTFLLVWSGAEEPDVRRLTRMVTRLPIQTTKDRRFRNVNILRALAIAADTGHRDAARELWVRARAQVRGDLAHGVNVIGERWFEAPAEWSFKRRTRRELLVPWVYTSLESDRESLLEDQFLAGSRSIWSFSWRLERFPGGQSVVAELQAIWAGALWALPDARRGQAIHMWNRQGKSHAAAVAANWMLGAGKDLARVLEWLEPAFDAASAEQIATTVHFGARVPRQTDWHAFLGAMWDELPEELLERLAVAALQSGNDSRFGEEAGRFVAGACRRLGPRLVPELRRLDASAASRVVIGIHPSWAAELPEEVRAWALDVIADAETPEGDEGQWQLLRLALGFPDGVTSLVAGQPLVTANAITFVAPPTELIREELRGVLDGTALWLDEMTRGMYGFGFPRAFVIARLADHCEDEDLRAQAVEILGRMITAPSVPAQERLEAVTALSASDLPGKATIKRPPVGGGQGAWAESGPTDRTVPVAWLGLRPDDVDWAVAGVELLAASRDSDPVLRATATAATASTVDLLAVEVVDGILLGALYDAQEEVLRPLLTAEVIAHAGAGTLQLLWTRLPERVATEGRSLRATVGRFLTTVQSDNESAAQLRQGLQNDRSWYVRRIAGAAEVMPD